MLCSKTAWFWWHPPRRRLIPPVKSILIWYLSRERSVDFVIYHVSWIFATENSKYLKKQHLSTMNVTLNCTKKENGTKLSYILISNLFNLEIIFIEISRGGNWDLKQYFKPAVYVQRFRTKIYSFRSWKRIFTDITNKFLCFQNSSKRKYITSCCYFCVIWCLFMSWCKNNCLIFSRNVSKYQ